MFKVKLLSFEALRLLELCLNQYHIKLDKAALSMNPMQMKHILSLFAFQLF